MAWFSSPTSFLTYRRRVLVFGLDNAGKSCIVACCCEGKNKWILPTTGLEIHSGSERLLSMKSFVFYDMGGQGRYRSFWQMHFPQMHALVFVVDAFDRARIGVARDELFKALQHPAVQQRPIPLLLLLNKIEPKRSKASDHPQDDVHDHEDAKANSQRLSEHQIHQIFHLDQLTRPWKLQSCSGHSGQGLQDGFQWLKQHVH